MDETEDGLGVEDDRDEYGITAADFESSEEDEDDDFDEESGEEELDEEEWFVEEEEKQLGRLARKERGPLRRLYTRTVNKKARLIAQGGAAGCTE